MNEQLPIWVQRLEASDLHFIKRMVLASGSLKQLAAEYEVSYPTIRQRLDRVIDRINLYDTNPEDDAFESRIRTMVAERDLEPSIAQDLLKLHRQSKEPVHE